MIDHTSIIYSIQRLKKEMKMKSKLEILLYEKNKTIGELSKELGMNYKILLNKLEGRRELKASDIRRIAEKLCLNDKEIVSFFNLRTFDK